MILKKIMKNTKIKNKLVIIGLILSTTPVLFKIVISLLVVSNKILF